MKKNFFLTIVTALLSITTGLAQFAPEAGKAYALQLEGYDLYMDVETKGKVDASDANCISLSNLPVAIYFEAGSTDGTWKIKNADDEYIGVGSSTWNVAIGQTTEWIIAEPESDIITISKSSDKYIGIETPDEGKILYSDVDNTKKHRFIVSEYSESLIVPGNRYALKVKDENLYLDIQTLGIKNGNRKTNNASLNAKPCIIYFAAGTTDNTKWKIKNANGMYLYYVAEDIDTGGNWNPQIGTESSQVHEWIITESNGAVTIAREDGKYVNANSMVAGEPLYCDKVSGLEFELLEYNDANLDTHYAVLKTTAGTFLKMTQVNDTYASFQDEATYFNIIPAGDYVAFQYKDDATKYLGHNHNWSATVDTGVDNNSTWSVSDAPGDGLVFVSRAVGTGSGGGKYLGSKINTNAGTGIYTNVDDTGNKWLLEETFEYETPATNANGRKEFKSPQIPYYGGSNTLRFTLTESPVYYSNGTAKRLSFDSFKLYDTNGQVVELAEDYFKGNNNKTFTVTDNSAAITGTWNNANATDDYFEINLGETDLGGSFSFSFATENTIMDARAFKIELFYEHPGYEFRIDAPQGETVTVTYNGNPIAEGDRLASNFNEALFEVTEFTDYGYKFVIDRENRTVTLVYEKKYTLSLAGAPEGVSVTYNGTGIVDGGYIDTEYDTAFLSVTGPNGYTWEITRDDKNKTVTITFTQLQSEVNPQAVVNLLNRIGGAGTADKFKIVLDPSLNSYGAEQFVIGNEDGKILIKGSTLSAITTGIGWYLQNIAHINIAWNSLNEKTVSGAAYADLSKIPVPTAEEVHTTDAEYRYYLNYCTFGYSMTSWTWERWQQEIDWMALHGINMPLQIIGLEEVWRKFLTMEDGSGNRKYNYTDTEAKAFVAGPAYTAWWGMNNLEGYGGTSADGKGGVQDDKWYTRQQQLATQILTRQRDLGMQPVLPGFSGMVPTNFTTKTGIPTDANGGSWGGFARPRIIDPTNERFAEIAADYYKCLKDVMGESRYYSMDPFHEGGMLSSIPNVVNEENRNSYKTAYKAVYDAMEIAKPGSQWVIQQWQWYWYQEVSVNAVPDSRMIVLDLFSDGSPAFDKYSGYAPQEAVFCAIPNFGGRSGLMGRLQNVTDNYFLYKGKYSSIKGIGAAPEAIEQTPVTYDLIFQLPWMNGVKPDVEEWVNNYAIARYGADKDEIKEAWSLLRQGPLNYGADGIQGPIEDVWAARPNLEANYASSWGSTLSKSNKGYNVQGTYTAARRQMLIDATYKLLSQSDIISGEINLSNYYYDLVEFGGAVLADYAHYLLLGIRDAKDAAGDNFDNNETYKTRRDAFLQLINDVDDFKGTNLNFRLGKWTQEARDAAGQVKDATTATPDWYEYNNARTLITTWGDSENNGNGSIANGLKDYSYRSWQGLLKDYYLPRWEYYFSNGCSHPNGNAKNYFYFEWNWAHGKEHYVGQTAKSNVALTEGQAGHTSSYKREPEGYTVEVATEVLGKYIIPVVAGEGMYYAYRHLTNDLTSVCTVVVKNGEVADLSNYFGELTDVTITGDFIDGTATDIKAVAIKNDATGDADSKEYTGTITITDSTVLTFKVVVNSTELAAAKEGLEQVIEDMKELTAQVGVFDPARELPLTTNENKPFYVWTNAQEDSEGPIANLVDGSTDTHFHSEYSTNIKEYHFINIDLGSDNALSSFKFSYNTRKTQTNFPKTIFVYGSNEREKNYVRIAEITNLPVGNENTSIRKDLDEITCNEKYAYLRFEVRATNTNNSAEDSGFPYFHMAEFDLYKLYTTATVYDIFKGTELTNEFAAEKYDVLLAAISVYDNASTKNEIAEATEALKSAYQDLLEKFSSAATITVPESGVTTLYLPFNVALPTGVTAYTIEPENIISDGNGGYVYTNLTEVASEGEKLLKGTPVIIKATQGSYGLPATLDDTDAVTAANSALRGTNLAQNINSDNGTKRYTVGASAGDVVFTRIDAETEILSHNCWLETTCDASTISKCIIQNALIEDGEIYRIRALMADGTTRRTLYNDGTTIKWTSETKTDASTLFITLKQGDTESYKLVSAMANGIWNAEAGLNEEGEALYFTSGTRDGTYTIYARDVNNDGDYRSFSVESNSKLGYYSFNDIYKTVQEEVSTDFEFENVDTDVTFLKTLKKGNNFATLFLPYNVTVPEGIKAYTATIDNKDKVVVGTITLNEVTGSVIPARTAVVLHRESNTEDAEFSFGYTTTEGTVYDGNLFDGRITTGYVGGETDKNFYLLLNGKKGEAFYKMYKEYNSDGTYAGENNGGYIKCEGNKAYMKLDAGESSSYSFRLPGTTAIEEVKGENEKVKGVYDLQGRKLKTESEKMKGLYIIDGKKVFIK